MFRIGDQVRAMNEDFEGKVAEILKDGFVLVEDESGFGFPYAQSDLVRNANFMDPDFEQIFVEKQENEQEKLKRLKEEAKKERKERKVNFSTEGKSWNLIQVKKKPTFEIDLHIHELVPSFAHLNNTQMLGIQMRALKNCVAHALENNISSIIAIHGIGEGTLKNEVRKYIQQTYHYMDFCDADYRKYGQGATEISINYGAKRKRY
ncbi:MAG: Smr/MutS family protein [Flavobacteriales bacterium]|jgi:dsDNA-specific endonuclease/ATPase MutS2|nr:Smr/MutS family protein [Flavobacteriales bacterium]